MKSALILNNIEDVKHCLKNETYEDNILFSTSSSVEVYLKEYYQIECNCLSKYLTYSEAKLCRREAYSKVDQLLGEMDSKISPLINSELKLSMNYFEPAYAHFSKYQMYGCLCFLEAVKKIIDVFSIDKITIYATDLNCSLGMDDDGTSFISKYFDSVDIEILFYEKSYRKNNVVNLITSCVQKLFYFPMSFKRKMSSMIDDYLFERRAKRFSENRKTVLLFENLGSLKIAKKFFQNENILYYYENSRVPLGFEINGTFPDLNITKDDFISITTDDIPLKAVLAKVMDDFICNVNGYLQSICLLSKINEKYPISIGIWGFSPQKGIRALVFEYLRSMNIKIIGSQHGACVGEQVMELHIGCDINRCDYYISYGFTEQDILRGGLGLKLKSNIMPFGKSAAKRKNKPKKKIDILFPVTNSNSMLINGMCRNLPDRLTDAQIKLLEYFNGLEGQSVYVKPFVGSSYDNCSVLPVFDRMKNLRIVRYLSLDELLYKYEPKIVVIELPSTPLHDVLGLDAEIFLMGDPMLEYEEQALEKLNKRVHYSKDVFCLIEKLNLFRENKLPKKRDNTFYNHYVYKDNMEEKTCNLMKNLLNDKHS